MVFQLTRLSVRNRIWTIVVIFIGSIVLGSIVDVLMLRDMLWRQKELQTRQQVENGFSVLNYYYGLQRQGQLDQASAQAAAIGTIRAMRYGDAEYFWLNDLSLPFPKIIMHPTMPELDGQVIDGRRFNGASSFRAGDDPSFSTAADDQNLFATFVEVVNRGGQGYVSYFWSKPQAGGGATGERFHKLSYVKKFAPWGWLIGTGVYTDDVEQTVRRLAVRNLLAVLGGGGALLLFASMLAHSITGPLRLTIASMRSIGAGSADLGRRLPAEGGSEIAELAGGFNDMLDHLQARDAELARHRASLEEEVARRTVELEHINARLETELVDRKQAEHAMWESRARMRALLDATDESVLLLDTKGKILAVNAFAASRFGKVPKAIIGVNFFDLIPPDLAISRAAALRQLVQTGQPAHMQDKRGATFFDNSMFPVLDEEGNVESVAVYAKDVSAQHRSAAVENIFRRLDGLLLKWRMNLDSIAQMFCDDILAPFDLPAAWVARAEKDGRLNLLASSAGLMHGQPGQSPADGLRWDPAPGGCGPAAAVLRSGKQQIVVCADGAWQSCCTAMPIADARAALLLPLALRGQTWGVLALYGRDARQFDDAQLTTRLAAVAVRLGMAFEAALQQEWLTLLDTALAGVDNAVLITDAGAHIMWANRAFEKLSGYSGEDIMGKTPGMFDAGAHESGFHERLWQTIRAGATWHGELVNARPDGASYTVSQTVTPLLNSSGQISHYVAIMEDISERKANEARIQHSASFDLLTDLPNRGLFFDRLGQALALAHRNGKGGALLFLDLDHFKQVNDELGHAAGDSLLIEVARRLSAQVRQSDTVARLGGDEFTVILPQLQHGDDAVRVAENILAAIAQPCVIAGHDLTIQISIGIALFPQHGENAEEILNAADNAMYLAKNSGRHRYALAGPAPQPEKEAAPGGAAA